MTTFNIDTAADVRELTAEETEIVAGGLFELFVAVGCAAWLIADATGGQDFAARVNRLVRG